MLGLDEILCEEEELEADELLPLVEAALADDAVDEALTEGGIRVPLDESVDTARGL